MNLSSFYSSRYTLLLITLLGIIVLLPVLKTGFFYDDYDHLNGALRCRYGMSTGQGTFWDVFRCDFVQLAEGVTYTHYRPGGYLITFLISVFGGGDPFWFGLLGLTLHIIVVILFWKVALILFEDPVKASWAALLFLTQDWALHAVIWPGAAIFYLPYAILFLSNLLLIDRYVRNPSTVALLLSAVLLLLSFTFLEAAYLSVPIILAYYLFLIYRREQKLPLTFFLRPLCWGHYAAVTIWIILLATQNLSTRTGSILASIQNRLTIDFFFRNLNSSLGYLSREISRLIGMPGNAIIIKILTVSIILALLLTYAVAIVLIFRRKVPARLRLASFWLIMETVPRFIAGALVVHGSYTIIFPLTIFIVDFVYFVAGKMEGLAPSLLRKKVIIPIILGITILVQIVRFEVFAQEWIELTSAIKSETEQLFRQSGSLPPQTSLVLLAPTDKQQEMVQQDCFRKRLRALADDYSIEVTFQLYDSSQAVSQVQEKNTIVMVGTPGQYYPFSPDLDIDRLIPVDLDKQYQKFRARRARVERQRGQMVSQR